MTTDERRVMEDKIIGETPAQCPSCGRLSLRFDEAQKRFLCMYRKLLGCRIYSAEEVAHATRMNEDGTTSVKPENPAWARRLRKQRGE